MLADHILSLDSIGVKYAQWHVLQRMLHQDWSPKDDTLHLLDNVFVPFLLNVISHILICISKHAVLEIFEL